ncbi:MAG: bifunctional folylpolyglutamate synthase/dihydrofolate synthase [Acutalibacteraceae bacterium]
MTYKQATDYIDSFLLFGSKLGLTRITKLLGDLGNPQDSLKFIHVAGTNGKGSACCYAANILKNAGYKTGLFISPYIVDFKERFQINGEMISENELCKTVEQIKAVVDTYPYDELPTEFEIVTAIGILYFYNSNCDVVLLEVGLGGRLDSTNVIKNPLCSVITSISLDHTQYLGDTLSQIAFEKGGIIKQNCPTVLYPVQKQEVFEKIKEICSERNSKLTVPDKNSVNTVKEDITGDVINCGGIEIKLPLSGNVQKYNALTAITAIKQSGLSVTDENIKSGIESAYFPARLELISQNPKILVDGAHNPDGVKALKAYVETYFDKPTAIIGMMKDKDIDSVLSQIAPLFSKIYTVTVNNPRSISAKELAKMAKEYCSNVFAADTVESAINKAKSENTDFCVCGSLYLCGEALKILK